MNQPSPDNNNIIRQISKRKVLCVELDEEITSIFEHIEKLKYNEVFLLVPERAALLQSIVNLNILKRKTEDQGKSLSLITNDPVGRKLALKAGIPIFDQLSPALLPSPKKHIPSPQELIQPIKAMANDLNENRPKRLNEKKLSIFDVVQKTKNKKIYSWNRLLTFINTYREKKELAKESRFTIGAPSRKTLGTMVVASLCLLFIISYIALPGATITIIPQSDVIEQSVNITLANVKQYGTNPSLNSPHPIAYYPLEVTVQKSATYTATGQIFEGTNARGTVTFINERTTPWPLVALTRIQTEDGLIFRIQSPVTIPAANSSGFGTVDATVVADETDAYGRVIGEKGNIGPASFLLPGLREESRKELYARNSSPMTGGSTVVTLKITQEDLDASKELIRQNLEAETTLALQTALDEQNKLNGTDLQLLTKTQALKLSEPTYDIPIYLLETLQDQFEVSGNMMVNAITYSKKELFEILKQELTMRKSPDKSLLKIDEGSLSYEIFEFEKNPGQIKLTATIKGIEAFAIDPSDENGAKLIKKIKEHIAGKPVKEAQDYIQNLPEVNKVKISCWPVWAPTIPSVFKNTEIKIDTDWLEEMKQ
ncbi:MAG: hypothetical protein UT55_C0003G0007 [Candidatus Peregrinibacteria bacterium GW2011_GWE2_39_6]|nr:MAG: hypothetical protein UT36_C0005G0104 [Candidatus Peregrinibacteria bacterium GW2011_GWF2_39_17]KKR26696.1 MAG: hypothetical protein UT55_C0003G0007 [Candidatus Peregrinibacteria bacterium GW2011_GWE2_39_6]HCW32939.1 hypothetical protein [Candidatus Peregrinibacteria bacterium]